MKTIALILIAVSLLSAQASIEQGNKDYNDDHIYCPSCGDSLINGQCAECNHELALQLPEPPPNICYVL